MPTRLKRVLIIEDNEADVFLVRLALSRAGAECEIETCEDGEKAQARLRQLGSDDFPCPDLLLLDLNLPKVNGDKVLEEFRREGCCPATPVIVMTSSDSPIERERVQNLGGVLFRKPTSLQEFLAIGGLVKNFLEADG